MSDLSAFEQRLYNSYLKAVAVANKRGFRYRKDFSKTKPEDYTALKKLGYFFAHNENVSVDEFFLAPFRIHDDVKYKALRFYTSPRAIQSYTSFLKQREKQSPDSEETITYTLSGVKFILEYCQENNITVDEYKLRVVDGKVPLALLHLKQHKINFYVIHALEIQSELSKLDVEWLDMFIGDFNSLFAVTETHFNNSTALRPKVVALIQAINQKQNKSDDINV